MNRIMIAALLLFSFSAIGQDKKDVSTKLDSFVSKTGKIIKFVDYKLSNNIETGRVMEHRVRKYSADDEVLYFFQLSLKNKYGSKSASIEYSDLIETLKAYEILKAAYETDKASSPDYLENKFTTEDGFQLGYYVSGDDSKWYIVLERYGSDNTVFIRDLDTLSATLNEAKEKIESLK